MDINYRKATSVDLEAIFQMSSILHESEVDRNKLEKLIETNLVIVAIEQDKVVGYVSVELFDSNHNNFPDSAFVSELFVDVDFRKKGIGSHLVDLALKLEFPDQYEYFSITHVPEKQYLTKFYEEHGFKKDRVLESGNVALTKDIKK